MKKLILPVVFCALFLSLSDTAFAANPSIASFSVSPTTINHGQPINISWTLADAGGHSLFITCPQGVTVKNINGNSFPCGQRTSVSNQASDAVTLLAYNNSGAQKQLMVTLIPKDGTATDFDAGQQIMNVMVGANQNPITSLTTATSTPSGATMTVSWTAASGIPGANIIIGCTTNDLTITSPSLGTQSILCGSNVSSTDLSANGSVSFVFTNKSVFDIPITLTVIPAIVSGIYDATHVIQNAVTVQGFKKIEPNITSFTSSSTQVLSGGTTLLSWATENASGVNMKFSCNDSISVAKVINNVTTTVACGNFLFDQPLTVTSATVMLTNMNYGKQTITASLLPANADNTYNGLRQKDIVLTVYGMGVTALPTPAQPITTVTPAPVSTTTAMAPVTGCVAGYLFSPITGQACPAASATQTASPVVPAQSSVSPASVTAKKTLFTRPLSRGMTNTEVKTLQQFFAKYPETYGNVLVTGYFGTLTEALVKKFQERHNVATKGNPGYGFVGPATRAKLNSLQ